MASQEDTLRPEMGSLPRSDSVTRLYLTGAKLFCLVSGNENDIVWHSADFQDRLPRN